MKRLQSIKWGYLLFALLLIGVGVTFIAQNEALGYVALTFGVLLTLFAAVYAVLTLALKERGVRFFFRMTLAVLALAGGVTSLILRDQTLGILLMLTGYLLIIDGSFKLQTTALAKRYRSPFFWVMMAISFAVIVGGILLTRLTFDTESVRAIFLGLLLTVDGAGNLASLFLVPYVERRARREAAEEQAAEAAAKAVEETAPVLTPKEEKAVAKAEQRARKQAKRAAKKQA